MNIRRPNMNHVLEYSGQTDEVILHRPGSHMSLRYEAFVEAFERRVEDDRYRPITEEQRAKETQRRTGGR